MLKKGVLFVVVCFIVISIGYSFEYDISVPEEVIVGEWFSVNVSVSSDTNIDFSTYSYIYSGYDCVGQGWAENKKEIHLGAGDEESYVLDDLVKFGTEQGWYDLRVKFRFDNENITETFNIKVIEPESSFVFKETYLYIVLIAVCIIGVYLAFKHNR